MDIYPLTRYLRGFAVVDELRDWSASVRSTVLERVLAGDPYAETWDALIELLVLTPERSSIVEPVLLAVNTVVMWPWPIRSLDYTNPVVRKDGGIALTLVGVLIIDRIEDLHGASLGRLAANPYVENLRGLRLRRLETLPEHIGRLLNSKWLRRLEAIEITKVMIGGAADEIFGVVDFPSLRDLTLVDTGISRTEFVVITRLPFAAGLERLRLGSPEIAAGLLEAALELPRLMSLKVLDLSQTRVSANVVSAAVERRRISTLTTVLLGQTPAAETLGDEIHISCGN